MPTKFNSKHRIEKKIHKHDVNEHQRNDMGTWTQQQQDIISSALVTGTRSAEELSALTNKTIDQVLRFISYKCDFYTDYHLSLENAKKPMSELPLHEMFRLLYTLTGQPEKDKGFNQRAMNNIIQTNQSITTLAELTHSPITSTIYRLAHYLNAPHYLLLLEPDNKKCLAMPIEEVEAILLSIKTAAPIKPAGTRPQTNGLAHSKSPRKIVKSTPMPENVRRMQSNGLIPRNTHPSFFSNHEASRFNKHGRRWDPKDLHLLAEKVVEGDSIFTISDTFARTPIAMLGRLANHIDSNSLDAIAAAPAFYPISALFPIEERKNLAKKITNIKQTAATHQLPLI